MRLPHWVLLPAMIVFLNGCGTMRNLDAPPPSVEGRAWDSTCLPFGGFARSASFGTGLIAVGAVVPFVSPEEWTPLYLGMGAAGVVVLATDAPVSLAGDLLTLPFVIGRTYQAPWAAWLDAPSAPPPPPVIDTLERAEPSDPGDAAAAREFGQKS